MSFFVLVIVVSFGVLQTLNQSHYCSQKCFSSIIKLLHTATQVRDLLRRGINLVSEALLLRQPCVPVRGEERGGVWWKRMKKKAVAVMNEVRVWSRGGVKHEVVLGGGSDGV